MRALTIAEAIGEGVISVPETLLDGVKRTAEGWEFWDKEQEVKIDEQNKRAYRALKKIIKYGVKGFHSPIEKAVRIILFHFYESLPKKQRDKLLDAAIAKGLHVGSKTLTSMGLSYVISTRLTNKIIASEAIKKVFRYTMSVEFTLLSMQGLLYQAGAASDRLQKKFPAIFVEMRNKDLDMIYFLIEKPMNKYLEAIRLGRMRLPVELV